jgi:hypothetical protein
VSAGVGVPLALPAGVSVALGVPLVVGVGVCVCDGVLDCVRMKVCERVGPSGVDDRDTVDVGEGVTVLVADGVVDELRVAAALAVATADGCGALLARPLLLGRPEDERDSAAVRVAPDEREDDAVGLPSPLADTPPLALGELEGAPVAELSSDGQPLPEPGPLGVEGALSEGLCEAKAVFVTGVEPVLLAEPVGDAARVGTEVRVTDGASDREASGLGDGDGDAVQPVDADAEAHAVAPADAEAGPLAESVPVIWPDTEVEPLADIKRDAKPVAETEPLTDTVPDTRPVAEAKLLADATPDARPVAEVRPLADSVLVTQPVEYAELLGDGDSMPEKSALADRVAAEHGVGRAVALGSALVLGDAETLKVALPLPLPLRKADCDEVTLTAPLVVTAPVGSGDAVVFAEAVATSVGGTVRDARRLAVLAPVAEPVGDRVKDGGLLALP